jgi:hypothetical protein
MILHLLGVGDTRYVTTTIIPVDPITFTAHIIETTPSIGRARRDSNINEITKSAKGIN